MLITDIIDQLQLQADFMLEQASILRSYMQGHSIEWRYGEDVWYTVTPYAELQPNEWPSYHGQIFRLAGIRKGEEIDKGTVHG